MIPGAVSGVLPAPWRVRINIITTEPVNPGVVEVVLVHDGQATYRNAATEQVVYDPATAVPVGYLLPSELSPAYTTIVVRPDINGVGGLAGRSVTRCGSTHAAGGTRRWFT